MLHVGKLLLHFLDDENGHKASVEMECLMAKAESVLQDVISKCHMCCLGTIISYPKSKGFKVVSSAML